MKTAVVTKDAPGGIGPYSQAIRVGEMLFTSGQIPINPATGAMVEGGIAEQTAQVCENLKAVLAAAGVGFAEVVKTTVFLKDMKDFTAGGGGGARYFAGEGFAAPARSTVQAAALPRDAMVEIDCVAMFRG